MGGRMETAVSRDGTRIAFDTSGSGPPLVVINGALSERSAALGPYLDPHFTVVAYDRRGRGASGDTPPYAPERELEDLAAVIEAAGAPAFVFGQSSGGILGLRAAMSGLPIRRLAVNEPPFIMPGTRPPPPADVPARLEALVAAGDRDGALRVFLGEQVGLPAPVLQQMSAGPMWPRALAMAHTAAYDTAIAGADGVPAAALATVTTKTLVLWGGASFPWINETARVVAKALPNAELVKLEGQTHSPAPDVLAPELVRFFLS
ncbi:MAG TPA: alpha/beta hydrolase [Polyangiaceae bacterium]|jgi:pimeloyl-ACP methyl ester carboxylesterase